VSRIHREPQIIRVYTEILKWLRFIFGMHCGYTGISTLDVTILTSNKKPRGPFGLARFFA